MGAAVTLPVRQPGLRFVVYSPQDPHKWIMGPPVSIPSLYGATSAGWQRWRLPGVTARGLVSGGLIWVRAWDVCSLRQDDRLPLLSRELLRVEMAAVSEVRRPGSGAISVGGYTYYWSGRSDGHRLQGAATAISSRLQPSVGEVTPVDERIMVL